MKTQTPYWKFKNETLEDVTLHLNGVIGYKDWDGAGVLPQEIIDGLKAAEGKNLTVRLNSPGGSVFDGVQIYNLLKGFKGQVTTVCDGLAASIASVIFCAGSKRVINKGGMLMIHKASNFVGGNADEMRKQADVLEKIESQIVDIYKTVSNLAGDKLQELINAETWFTGQEALASGFATEVGESDAGKIENLSMFNFMNCPDELQKDIPILAAHKGHWQSVQSSLLTKLTDKQAEVDGLAVALNKAKVDIETSIAEKTELVNKYDSAVKTFTELEKGLRDEITSLNNRISTITKIGGEPLNVTNGDTQLSKRAQFLQLMKESGEKALSFYKLHEKEIETQE